MNSQKNLPNLQKTLNSYRILFFLPFNTSMTGGPRVLVNLLGLLDRKKVESYVISTEESPFIEEVQKLGIEPVILEPQNKLAAKSGRALNYDLKGKWTAYRQLGRYNDKVYSIIKERKLQLIWVRNLKGVLFTGGASRKAGIPLIWDIGMETESKGLVRLLHFYGLLRATVVVTEGGKGQQKEIFGNLLYRIFRRKFRTISPGIPRDRIEKIYKNTGQSNLNGNASVRLLSIGSIGSRKNQMALIQAVKELHPAYPNLNLKIVGPIVEEGYFKELVRVVQEENLTDCIHLAGWSEDIPGLLSNADIFSLVSFNEGIPYVIHEAMHAGLPVIASNVGGIPSAVEDGKTGFLVDPRDKEQLKTSIKQLIDNPALRNSMGAAGRDLASRKFTPEKWASRYTELMVSLIERNITS